jgi:hypothetical protein
MLKPHHLPAVRVAVFALAWMLISQLMISVIDWMRTVSQDQPFYNFRDYYLRYSVPAELMMGVLLGWLLFALLNHAQNKSARIAIILSCLGSVVFSYWAAGISAFVPIWTYLPFQISFFANQVLTVILMACCGFTAAAIVILAGFGLAQGLHWAFTRTAVRRPT